MTETIQYNIRLLYGWQTATIEAQNEKVNIWKKCLKAEHYI